MKSFVSKGVTCKLCLEQWDTQNWIICLVKCAIQSNKKLKYIKFLNRHIGVRHLLLLLLFIRICVYLTA